MKKHLFKSVDDVTEFAKKCPLCKSGLLLRNKINHNAMDAISAGYADMVILNCPENHYQIRFTGVFDDKNKKFGELKLHDERCEFTVNKINFVACSFHYPNEETVISSTSPNYGEYYIKYEPILFLKKRYCVAALHSMLLLK